jgi:hypothetical protein
MANQFAVITSAGISKGAEQSVVVTAKIASGEEVAVFVNKTVANVMLGEVLIHTKNKVSAPLLAAVLVGSEVNITLKVEGEDYADKSGNILGQHTSTYYTIELEDARPVQCDNVAIVLDFASGYLAKQSPTALTALSATKLLKDNKADYDMLRSMELIPDATSFMAILMKVAVAHYRSPMFDLDITTPISVPIGGGSNNNELDDFIAEAKLLRTTAQPAEQQMIDTMLAELLNQTKSLDDCKAILATIN